ncbi:MAG: Lysine 6-dehydrogenase [Actinobacteria bacterium ADurb.Bin444]|nr:MAG: Lysine 6-dehydrogenase [Actinobacteria bacterium ADurb.Bin444]
MKKILVLGAGMVAGAHVQYLLQQPDFHVTVATRTVGKAQEIVGDHPRGRARALDISDDEALGEAIAEHDLSVSLLPFVYHPVVARHCVEHAKPMVTTSYVKEEMAALDGLARAAGVVLLNEMGVDPGIDHMTAMRVITEAKHKGGRIVSFTSWCGGLPAPEANNNPFGYKFSWSPRGVLLAGKNPALYMEDGREVFVPGEELFQHRWDVPVEIEGRRLVLEGYPNRNSLPYVAMYGIGGTGRMFRGTLRNKGWCRIMGKIMELGYLGEDEWLDLGGKTFAGFTADLVAAGGTQHPGPGASGAAAPAAATGSAGADLRTLVRRKLSLAEDAPEMQALEWLGLLAEDPLPITRGAPVDVLTARMLERMSYGPGERDMLVLKHEFLVEYPESQETVTSTMIDFGIPGGFSSMNRTVGLPAAIGARMILEGKIRVTGVHVPVLPEIYEPVLIELEKLGLHFHEAWERLD